MKVIFRAEASTLRGWGHIMRCSSLAKELQARGVKCGFWCNAASMGPLEGFELVNSAQGAQWLVVDSYDLDGQWVAQNRGDAKVLRIGDESPLDSEWDLFLNQNYGARGGERVLAGPEFALLRDEFRSLRAQPRYQCKKVVVSYGGTDPTHETPKALEALKEVGGWHKVWVLGSEASSFNVDLPNLEIVGQVSRVAQFYAMADLALGAGGISHFERAALGLPSLVTTVAENQIPGTQALAQDRFVRYLGGSADVSTEALVVALREMQSLSREDLQDWSRRLGRLVDAQGACRVAEKMIGFNK